MVDDTINSNITITIVYDNNEYEKRLKTAWGFSCVVKLEDKSLLFDTGGDSPTLLSNMEKIGIDPKKIDMVMLSHIHSDHTGGLTGFLDANPNVVVYVPESFPENLKHDVKSYGANTVDVSEPIKICDRVYTTGELGNWIKEQSLIIKTENGLIIITGCAHPGIVNIVKRTKQITKENVYLVMGGFHLSGTSDTEIDYIIKSFIDMGIEKVAPCHCTGDRAIIAFEKEYKDNFIDAGVGKIIQI